MDDNQNKNSQIDVDEIFRRGIKEGASDVHLSNGLPPTIRVTGVLKPLPEFGKIHDFDIEFFVAKVLNEKQLGNLYQNKELDTSYELGNKERFRMNVFFDRGKLALTARLIPPRIPTLEELNLPTTLYEFCKLPHGLVLVTGPAGVGKSSTLAAMINWINNNKNKHILTIEDPIEYAFTSNKSLMRQRELNVDTLSWAGALRSALRENVDVILVGEIRDFPTMELAITATEKGHLVFATIHTYSAAQTLDHIIGMAPEHQQAQIRMQIASVLEGVVTQTLIRGVDQSKRFPALEILLLTNAVRNTIREGNTHFINNIINTSYDIGMNSMERSLASLVSEGKIELDEALTHTLNQDDVIRYLKPKKQKQ